MLAPNVIGHRHSDIGKYFQYFQCQGNIFEKYEIFDIFEIKSRISLFSVIYVQSEEIPEIIELVV